MNEPNESQEVETATAEDGETIIRGKVVDFVNPREIVMNVGKRDGVKIGMQFAVLVPGGVPVEFGEGEETITETVEVAKAIVKVVRLSGERLSIGRTFMTIKGHPAHELRNLNYYLGSSASVLGTTADMLQPTRKIPAVPDRIETFDVGRKDTIRGQIDKEVRKGDEVRLTTSDEFIFP